MGVIRVQHPRETQLRQQLVEYTRKLQDSGLILGTAGNLSARVTDGHFLITPTGLPYDTMIADDICVVGIPARQHSEPIDAFEAVNLRKPSSETPMHTQIYVERADVRAIVHTHSLYATAFASAGRAIEAVHYVIATMGNTIPVVPYFTYGSQELADAVGEAIRTCNGLLLQNHGVIAVGKDLDEAFYHAQTIEYLAHLMSVTQAVGEPQILTPGQLDDVRSRFRGYGQGDTRKK